VDISGSFVLVSSRRGKRDMAPGSRRYTEQRDGEDTTGGIYATNLVVGNRSACNLDTRRCVGTGSGQLRNRTDEDVAYRNEEREPTTGDANT
jgi:hypothetical protein